MEQIKNNPVLRASQNSFGDKVRMLYTDTNLCFLQFVVEDLAKEINARPQVRDAFDFSEISREYISSLTRSTAQLDAGRIGYFKDECKGNPIVEFVGLRPKIMEAVEYDQRRPPLDGVHFKHKAVAKGVSRANIKNFTHDDYVAMCREGEAFQVTNRRNGSKLHQVFLTVNYGYNIKFYNIPQSCRFTRWSMKSADFVCTITSATCLAICKTARQI